MRHFFQKLIAFITAAVMLLPSSALAAGSDGTDHTDTGELDYTIADAIFDEVYTVAQESEVYTVAEEEPAVRSIDDPIQRIYDYLESAEGVKDGSVSMNGDGCVFWQTENGITCSYSTRLQEIMESAQKPAEEDDAPDVQIQSYAPRRTSHGSDVYLFQPYFGLDGSFTRQYQTEAERIAAAADGTYHYYKAAAATVDAIADAVEDGGVIIFDSHGSTDYDNGNDDYTTKAKTSYLCLQSGEGLTKDDYKDGHAVYGGGSGQMKYYQVDGTVIANHMERNANNGLLWMAICLGMATDGLEAPLMEKGLGAVYGYSQSVTFVGDYTFEEAFFDSLLAGNDVAAAISDMKDRCGKWDYSRQIVAANNMPSSYTAETYEEALRKKAAFPIVVSTEDAYPGHGKVDAEQTVNSTWALMNQYNLTTQTDTDNDRNTIETRGATITAKPTEGYYASGYTVTPEGAATVKQDGNVFRVSAMREDCTVTIHFAAKTAGTVHFSVPDGVTQTDEKSYVGDTVVLPKPQGTPESTLQEYHFVGWTEMPVETPAEAADYIKAGESYTLNGEDVTLYALYQYFATPEGTTPHFYELKSAPEDWSGTYVITGGSRALLCDGSQAGLEMGNAAAAVSLESAGMNVDENGELFGVSGTYAVQITAIPGTEAEGVPPKYAIRLGGATGAVYLACRSNSDQLNTSADFGTTFARWTITWENGHIVCKNVRYPGRTLQFCTDNQYFRCVTSVRKDATPLTIYRGDESSLWYTTNLSSEAPETVAAPVIAPNGGTFKDSQTVTITCATADAKIYYTTDGSIPTTSSTLYSTPISLTATTTIKAIAVKDGMTNSAVATATFTKESASERVTTPVIAPNGGIFKDSQTVTITCVTADAKIYYTTDGSEPTTSSTLLYSTPIFLTATTTIKAIAVKDGMTNSEVVAATFTKETAPETVTTPVIVPNGGTFKDSQTVTITCVTADAKIYYTTDGSIPTKSSTLYSTPISLTATTTIKAIAVKNGMTNSAVATATFTKESASERVTTPVITPSGGTFKDSQTVTITCVTADAKIYYTTDGSIPTKSSTLYSTPISLTATTTIKAIAVKNGMTNSLVATATFTKRDDSGSSSGGGGGGGGVVSATYAVNVGSVENGAVTVNPKNAGRGDTVTITVSPNRGYQLDQLSVTDTSGKALSLTDKGSGKYTFTMPSGKVTVTAIFKAESIARENLFKDVSNDAYYKDAVLWAVSKGITSGTTATTFSPNASCTRAQMVTFLWRAAGSPKASGSNPFGDVPADAYYYDAVLWAVENGITSGTSATTFAPDATVTRGQTAAFLYRAAGSPAASGSGFSDVSSDAYYADAVAWAVQKGITSGTGNGRFSPDAACTRGQIVAFLYRQSRT